MLVLGGGVAGLGAARELARHGVVVTVIETKERLGGRIHTIREGALRMFRSGKKYAGQPRAPTRIQRASIMGVPTAA